MAEVLSPFEVLIRSTKNALARVAEHTHRNISDTNLLRSAAAEVLSRLKTQQVKALLIDLLERRDPVVCGEVVALLASLHEIDVDHAYAYYDERHPPKNYTLRYRFEAGVVESPKWLSTSSPRDYVLTVIAEAVAVHLLERGDWERPAHLAPSRRGGPLPQSATAS